MADWPYSTSTWQRLRRAHLSIEPTCRACRDQQGRIVLANTVDHVVPIGDGGPAFPEHTGLASYCAACHNRKTARGTEAGAIRTTKPIKGCDVDGIPHSPDHPWNVQRGTK
jgi:5-methylcytosine-specific restriction protein A